jgi:hypothetical protein
MLKDSKPPIFPSKSTHRTYTQVFKAQIVAACQHPGVSIASLVGRHGMNVNVVHRWLKECERNGCRCLRHRRSHVEFALTLVLAKDVASEYRKGLITGLSRWSGHDNLGDNIGLVLANFKHFRLLQDRELGLLDRVRRACSDHKYSCNCFQWVHFHPCWNHILAYWSSFRCTTPEVCM